MAKRKLKKGSALKDINAKEYRNLYNTGDLMSVDAEGYPTMHSSEAQVIGEAPEWLRLQRQKQAAQWSNEELERYMYSGKKPKRDVGYNLSPEERLKIYNSVVPFSYPENEIIPALNRYMTGSKRPYGGRGQEITEVDEDAWAQYMGVPQLYNTVEKSRYKPTSTKEAEKDYYTIRKGYEDFDDMLLWDAENAFSRPNTKDYYVKTSSDGKTKRGFNSSFLPLENVTLSKGTDDRGDYYSVYDIYDFDIPMQEMVGKPYEVYDRVYYKDYGSGNKVMRYTDNELLNEKVTEDNYRNISKELQNRNYLIKGFEEPTLESITQSLNAFQKNKKANGGIITNTMKKKKTKTLPLDNNLPKAFLGAMLNKWKLPTGAAAGGGGDGANSLSNMNNSSLSTAGGPLGGVMKMLNGPLAPLMGMATNAVTNMAHAINTPETERRPTLQNAASYTFDNGGTIKGKRKKKAKGGFVEPIDPIDKDAAINEMNRNITSILSGKPLKTGLTMTKLNPNEEATYQEWVKSLTPNLQGGADDKYYDMRGAWQVGEQPELFYNDEQGNFQSAHHIDVNQQGSIYEPHLFSRNPITGKSLKSPYHTSFQHALEGDIKSGGTPHMNLKTGDFYTYGTGGTIKIKPSKKGTFTAAAKKHGKSVQAFASQVLANPDNYSSAMVKKANFARNASKWKKSVGGVVEGYSLMPNEEMQFANMPAAFDYANGGLTGTYMDAFDAMAYGGTIDPSMYMQQLMYGSYAEGGEITDPTNPINPTPIVDPYTTALKEYEDNLYLYNTKQQLINALKDKSLSQAQITDFQQKNLGMGKYKDNPIYKNKKNIKNIWVDDVDQTRFHSLRTYDWAKPELRVPEVPTDEVDNIMSRLSTNGNTSEYQMPDPGPMPKEDSLYKTLSDIKYSPEDIDILGKIKGKGLRRSGMWLNLTDEDKLKAYKRGSNFEDMPEKDVRGPGYYAMGGQIPQNIPVEVEGEEMYEMPNGQTGEFKGPKHENGGMPMALPEGTKIYSDRLKVNGKTMAARKDKREANIAKLEKLLTKNPNDKFVKEAIKRQQETNALQEQNDMQQQEMANEQQAQEEMAMEEMLMGAAQQDMQEGMMMAMGGMIKRADGSYSQRGLWDNIRANAGSGKKPTKQMLAQEKKIKRAEKAYGGMIKYAGGTPPYGLLNYVSPTLAANVRKMQDEYDNSNQNFGKSKVYSGINLEEFGMYPEQKRSVKDVLETEEPTNKIKIGGQWVDNPYGDAEIMDDGLKGIMSGAKAPIPTTANKKPNKFMNFLNNVVDQTGDFFSGLFDKDGKPKTGTTGNEYDLTEGDRTGMFGTSMGMYGPAAMTMLNRMETPKNTNFFSTFGQDALRTQEEAEGLAGISKDEAYRKNLMRANALRKQLANSARGVGDIRSGQLSAELAEQEGARGILTNYLQGMSGLKGQRAQLQQQIDQTRMGGEYQRDLADRQDIDQYYTNLAENVANASNMMQKQGRDLNVVQYNKDIINLSKGYSKYGIYAVKDPRSGLYTLAHKDANGKITYLTEDEAKELANKQSTVTTTTVEEPK